MLDEMKKNEQENGGTMTRCRELLRRVINDLRLVNVDIDGDTDMMGEVYSIVVNGEFVY